MSNATKNAAQQVSHWVHDEVSCVTVQRIVQTFHLSWSASLSLLKDIPKGGNEYSVTVWSSSADPGSSDTNSEVIRLVSTKYDDDSKPEESASWYALALTSCNESIQAACERDRSQFHENIAEFTLDESSDFVAVPAPMKARMEMKQGKRTATDAFDDEPKARKSTKSAPIVAKKISSTTAKDFFGNKGKSSSTSKTTTSSTTASSKSKPNKTVAKSKQSSSFFQPKKNEGGSQQNAASSKAAKKSADEEKENVQNKSSEVGNADDFVGDIDDDDDDADDVSVEAEKVQPNKKPPAAAAAKKRGPPKQEEPVEVASEDEEEEKSEPPAAKMANDGPKPRRRKKVMEEKNFTDENGYFYTKTVAVWKDIESDEEQETFPVKSKTFNQPKGNKGKKKTATNPKAMKQSSLQSFFAKKK